MADDRILGGGILGVSVLGVVVYFWLVFMSPWAMLTIQVSAFLAVAAVLLIMAWIGYTLATTPPPVPIEDLDLDFGEDEEEEEVEEEESEEESEGEAEEEA